MGHRVFISYSSTDLVVASAIREALEARGFSCWMAPRNITPGVFWADAIFHAIADCDVFVLVLSARSNGSRHVLREVELAVDDGCFLIPYRIENVMPDSALSYFIRVTHWLDAVTPAPLAEENLQALTEGVQRGLDAAGRPKLPGGQDAATTQTHGGDGCVEALRLLLVDEMVRQGDSIPRVDHLWHEHEGGFRALLQRGALRLVPSVNHPGATFVAFAHAHELEAAVVDWIRQHRQLPVASLLEKCQRAVRFGDGLASYIAEQWLDEGAALFRQLITARDQVVERVVAGVVTRLESDEEPPRDEGPAMLTQAVELILSEGSFPAVRGLALGVQAVLERGRPATAERLFERLRGWSSARQLDADQQQFLLEVANELGRTWLRQGQAKRAEGLFRELLPQAERLRDVRLSGVVTNNLARAILDQPSPVAERVREAVQLLQHNIEQLAASPYSRHLTVAHHNLGDACLKLADLARAEFHFRRDVEICRKTDDLEALADALDRLGVFLADSKRYGEAREVHEEEQALFERFYDLGRQARALANLGRCCLGQGYADDDRPLLETAAAALDRAAKLYSSLDLPKEYAPTLENLGRTRYLLGDKQGGIRYLRESAVQYRRWAEGEVIAEGILGEVGRL